MQNHNSIKEWAEDDRPREKMLTHGRRTLSDAELLAILLGSGSAKESAVDLAKRILKKANNNWHELSRWNEDDWFEFKGIGPAKAVKVMAALEIGTRKSSQKVANKVAIHSSSDAYHVLEPKISDLNHEEFWTLFLNRKNAILSAQQIGVGGLNATTVDLRIILKKALQLNAAAILIAHNHPSGNTTPSQADKLLTKKIKEAAKLMDIKLLDHLIVVQKDYFSFADAGIL